MNDNRWQYLNDDMISDTLEEFAPNDETTLEYDAAFLLASATLTDDDMLRATMVTLAAMAGQRSGADPEAVKAIAKDVRQRMVDALEAANLLAMVAQQDGPQS